PDPDPLAASHYSCAYWIDHLCDLNPVSSTIYAKYMQDGGVIDIFLREKYLYWLEALSLCKSMPKGVVSMAMLQSLVQGSSEAAAITELVYDAHRFIMYHKGAIEGSPLQAYASALLFSPARSLVRGLFQHEEPEWIAIKPAMSDSWSACLQTLEGHSGWVRSVAFSHDSTYLATASDDRTVKVWDASNGACLRTFNIGTTLHNLSFDSTGSYLHTEIGTIVIRGLGVSSMTDIAEPKHSKHTSAGISLDRTWITYTGKNILWVPSEYRPSRCSVYGDMVGIGTGSGRVLICKIDPQHVHKYS
ncbi:WD40-repeat-containing domain protein, partial [Lineolata rhizophorae]